jgi:peptidoglycan/LPS O-acetylase OafA/YrhL
MGRNAVRAQRDLALTWGAMAEILLVVAAWVWLTSPAARDAAPWGPDTSVAVVAVAAVATAAALVAVLVPQRSTSRRWMVALCVAVAAGAVASMALTGFVTGDGTGVGVALLLAWAVVLMVLLAAHVARGPAGTRSRPS